MAKPKKETKGQGMKFTDPRKDNTNDFGFKEKPYLKGEIAYSASHGFGKIIEVRQEDNGECIVWVHFNKDRGSQKD